MDLSATADLLRAPAAGALLQAALAGGTQALPGFTADLTSWHYRPGSEVTAGYVVGYEQPGGGRAVDHLFATSATVAGPVAVVTGGGQRVAVWRHPTDPRLPGLAPATDPAVVLDWLAAASPGQPPAEFDLTLLSYRPLRRAVLRARTDGADHYLKVLRPERAGQLERRQLLLAEAGLTPALLATPAPGVLLTPAAEGRPLSQLLADPTAQLPTAADLVALLDRLPPAVSDLPPRPAWSERLDFHAATANDRLPGPQPHRLAEQLAGVLAAAPVEPVRATHGDFYEANIIVSGQRGLNLIDVDSVGPGRREDDLACLLAHLAVLPGLAAGHYTRVPEVLNEWTEDFSTRVHPAALAARVAAVLLSLVAGAADEDQAGHRLRLAREWADRSMRGL